MSPPKHLPDVTGDDDQQVYTISEIGIDATIASISSGAVIGQYLSPHQDTKNKLVLEEYPNRPNSRLANSNNDKDKILQITAIETRKA